MPINIIQKGLKKEIWDMGINITHTLGSFQFESRENLKNTANDILNKQGASQEAAQKIIDKTIFNNNYQLSNIYSPQLAIIKASSQITANNSLKETLKYLKTQANKKAEKKHTLGELWEIVNKDEEIAYQGELVDFVIDNSLDNIFAA